MLDQAALEALQKKIKHSFSDIAVLKNQILSFHMNFVSGLPKQVPFGEAMESVVKFQVSSLEMIQYEREMRQDFNALLYEAIQLVVSEEGSEKYRIYNAGEKKRRELFKYASSNNHMLSAFVNYATLKDIPYLSASDAMYGELMEKLSLFVCRAVFMDLRAQNKAEDIPKWLVEPLLALHKDFEKRARSYDHLDYMMDYYGLSVTGDHFAEPYEKAILGISLPHIHKPLELTPLKSHFLSDEGQEGYYRQWLPYILEESRESIHQQARLIKEKQLPSFRVSINNRGDADKGVVVCQCEARRLPEIDHPFSKEAVVIQPSGGGARDPLTGIFAIASTKYFDKDSKKYKLVFHVLAKDVETNAGLFSAGVNWNVQWLAGLIGFSRMYAACTSVRKPRFMQAVIEAKLPKWPEQDQIAYLQAQSVHSKLNPSQFRAVSGFHQADTGFYCLQGPPGTGKTTTVVHLLKVMCQDSASKILVCAPSNKAVRVLASRTAKYFPGLPIALTGVAKDLPDHLRPYFVNDHANRLVQRMEHAYDDFKKLYSGVINTSDFEAFSFASSVDPNEICLAFLTCVKECIDLSESLLSPSKFELKYQAKEAVEGLRESMKELYDAIADKLEQYQALYIDFKEKLARGEINPFPTLQQSQQLKNISSGAVEEKQLESLFNYISAEYCAGMKKLQNTSESIEILLLQRAQVVFCTLVSSGRPWLKKHISHVDILIVDEAAQSVEPEALIPMVFQPSKCLHVGDPKQLPATIISQAAQERQYDQSMMSRLMEIHGQGFQMLDVQYRMHPAICAFPSKQYYGTHLHSESSLAARPSPLLSKPIDSAFKAPCVFFDVRGAEQRHVGFSRSIQNETEAKQLIEALSCLMPHLNGITVGVITYYAAQVRLLKQLLARCKSPFKKNISISTVDGFQGEEKDLIFLSTVRSSRDIGFLKDRRRFNVSITRPRHHLYLFGNKAALLSSKTDLTQLIQGYEQEVSQNSPHHRVVALP